MSTGAQEASPVAYAGKLVVGGCAVALVAVILVKLGTSTPAWVPPPATATLVTSGPSLGLGVTLAPYPSPMADSVTDPLPPGALVGPGFSLRAGPIPVPLQLLIPSIHVDASVLGVGVTPNGAMDAPGGEAGDANYAKAFWYRGGGVPGEVGTATIAGHYTGRVGEPAIFSRLDKLKPGDFIFVNNIKTGQDVLFIVTETKVYSSQQAADPAVLARVYGSGPVAGDGRQPAPDGLAHLTLITCTGDWANNAFDHRLVVYATRSG